MFRRTALILFMCALVSLIASCRRTRIPPGEFRVGQGQEYRVLKDVTSLPADWGNLVSVTSVAKYPDAALLWFQDSAGNLRMVSYVVSTRQIWDVTLIRRH